MPYYVQSGCRMSKNVSETNLYIYFYWAYILIWVNIFFNYTISKYSFNLNYYLFKYCSKNQNIKIIIKKPIMIMCFQYIELKIWLTKYFTRSGIFFNTKCVYVHIQCTRCICTLAVNNTWILIGLIRSSYLHIYFL